MEAELKVLVERDRDGKKNAKSKRGLLKGWSRPVVVSLAAVVLVTALCMGLVGLSGRGTSVAGAMAAKAKAEVTGTEAASALADAEEADDATIEPTMFAGDISFTVGNGIVMKLFSESSDEEDFFPADFGAKNGADVSVMTGDAIAANSAAGDAQANEAGDAVNAAPEENKDGSAVTVKDGNNESDVAQEVEEGNNDIAGNDADTTAENEDSATPRTRMDEIEDMVESIPAPEDVPSKLHYRYNPAMMIEQTAENIEVLERIVEAEATDQDVYGRMLVANVVINRVHSKYFKNTVKGVVFEKIGGYEQFAPIRDGRYFTVPITEKTREAVRRVLAGEDYSDGALYFFQRDITTTKKAAWFDNNLKYLFKYGCHEFYTEFSEYGKQ